MPRQQRIWNWCFPNIRNFIARQKDKQTFCHEILSSDVAIVSSIFQVILKNIVIACG